MTQRTDRVGETLRRAVQGIISRGLADPRLQNVMITVTEAHVTTDLHNATVLVTITPDSKESLALHALKAASGHIRHHAAERLLLPKMPELAFKIDKGLKKQAGVLEALRLVEKERAERAGASPPEPPSTPDADSTQSPEKTT